MEGDDHQVFLPPFDTVKSELLHDFFVLEFEIFKALEFLVHDAMPTQVNSLPVEHLNAALKRLKAFWKHNYREGTWTNVECLEAPVGGELCQFR